MKSRRVSLPLLILALAAAFFTADSAAKAWAASPPGAVIEDLNIRASITDRGVVSVEEILLISFDGQPLRQDLTRGISGHYTKSGREKNRTGFVLLNATLDDRPTKTVIQRNPESLRLTLGQKGEVFTPGRHVFKLKYELINMIVFHPEQDMLIWRVLRESSCPVLQIAVDVSLPNSGKRFGLFSGQLGDLPEGMGLRANDLGQFSTSLPLEEGQSLTLYMSWDKGLVANDPFPDAEWRSRDVAVLFLLLGYYVLVWFLYGRPSRRASVVPGVAPPEGLSPGLLRSLRDMKADARVLTAEILGLAVRGYVHLDDFTAASEERNLQNAQNAQNTRGKPPQGKVYGKNSRMRYSPLERMMERKYRLRLCLRAEDSSSLNETEKLLLHNLFYQDGTNEIVLDGSAAKRLKTTFRTLVRNFSVRGQRFLFQNMRFWTVGLFAFEAYTAFAMFRVLSQGVGGIEPDSTHALAFMAPLFFLAPFLGGEKIWKQGTFMFILRTCVPLFFCASALAILKVQRADLTSIAALVGSIAVIGIFWKLAPVRSREGLNLLDDIEGFQLGLGSRAELKEQDTIEKFELLFPYACALDQEQALITRYAPLITQLRHRARWHTANTFGFSGGAEYFSLTYELGEVIRTILDA